MAVKVPSIGITTEPPPFGEGEVLMRYYFHLVNGSEVILDDTGIEISDLGMAQREALKAIQEIRQEADQLDENWHGWRLNVVDQSGTVLLSIRLDITLP